MGESLISQAGRTDRELGDLKLWEGSRETACGCVCVCVCVCVCE